MRAIHSPHGTMRSICARNSFLCVRTFANSSLNADTVSYTHLFFGNLLLGTDYELKNRYMHIDYVEESNSQSAKQQIPKCQFGTLDCTLEELAVLDLIKKNPTIKQQELADITGKSIRSVKPVSYTHLIDCHRPFWYNNWAVNRFICSAAFAAVSKWS